MKKQPRTIGAQQACRAFTLLELLISIVVLGLIILCVAQVVNNAAAVARPANKHIETDTQARVILDRMALDFAQMLKRTDIDYYFKGESKYNGHGNGHAWGQRVQTGQQGSDQIAFFTQVAGYYPSTGSQSPLSLVAYRINQNTSPGNPSYLMLERLGKGLDWNGVSNPNIPIVFLPMTIDATWPAAVKNDNSNASKDSAYETIGPQVFRFEYYYLLKNGRLNGVPWNTDAGHTAINGLTDVQAIGVTIAVIDPASRALINAANPSSLFDLASDLADFKTAPGRGVGQANKYIGGIEASWQAALLNVINGTLNQQPGYTSSGTPVPLEAAKAVRFYTRYFDLRAF
jgi:prepilin-type N-terminal cleavage/methylation domain-containing protein